MTFRNHLNISHSPNKYFFLDLHFGVEDSTEGLIWWMEYGIIKMAVGEAFQRVGTETIGRKAVHSKWAPPLSMCVNFRKYFALKSGLFPFICYECRITKELLVTTLVHWMLTLDKKAPGMVCCGIFWWKWLAIWI